MTLIRLSSGEKNSSSSFGKVLDSNVDYIDINILVLVLVFQAAGHQVAAEVTKLDLQI